MKARVRNLLDAVPFRPFVICLADGREYRIDHPDLFSPLPVMCPRSLLRSPMAASVISLSC